MIVNTEKEDPLKYLYIGRLKMLCASADYYFFNYMHFNVHSL